MLQQYDTVIKVVNPMINDLSHFGFIKEIIC